VTQFYLSTLQEEGKNNIAMYSTGWIIILFIYLGGPYMNNPEIVLQALVKKMV